MLTIHVIEDCTSRIIAFGLAPAAVLAKVESARDLVAQRHALREYVLLVARADTIITCPDGSNGDLLCAVVRGNKVITLMLRRSTQIVRVSCLPYVVVDGEHVKIM